MKLVLSRVSRLVLPAAALSMLLCLSGCTDDDNQREPSPVAGSSAPHAGASSGGGLATPAPVAAAAVQPLRRTALTSVDDYNALTDERLENLADIPSFDASRSDDGRLLIRAQTLTPGKDVAKTILTLMEQLGFKFDQASGTWSCAIGADQAARNHFNATLSTQLLKSGVMLSWVERNRHFAHQPGRMQFKSENPDLPPSVPISGRLVYTGHPLDVAFADTANPHWFVAVKLERDGKVEPLFLRGGRLFVSEENTIGIEQFSLVGEPLRVPADAQSVSITRDGRLSAVRADGTSEDVGRLPIVKLESFQSDPSGLVAADPHNVTQPRPEDKPLRDGHLEFPDPARLLVTPEQYPQELMKRHTLEHLTYAIAHPTSIAASAVAAVSDESLTIHADLPWAEHHLKALGFAVEHAAGQTVIAPGGDAKKLCAALAKVLQVLRLRMTVHDQNLRNADKVRDADGRLNPYRRKVLTINAQGDPVEGDDPSPFPKTYKLGDPNADAEGFVVLPNVNRAVELSEFQAAREEYKLIRAAAERLDPRSIFPDPPSPP